MAQEYYHDHLAAVPPLGPWFGHNTEKPNNLTLSSNSSHSYCEPSLYFPQLPAPRLASSNGPIQPGNPCTVSAEDQWDASRLLYDIRSGRVDRSAVFPDFLNESFSWDRYPSNTLQVEESHGESHGMMTSQPPPCLSPETAALLHFTSLPENTTNPSGASLSSPGSNLCQRRGRDIQHARYHPASVPQHLRRGMRKNWGPAAAEMNLDSTVNELHCDDIDDEVIDIVKEIFLHGFTVEALMRKMTKNESQRYLNGEKGQAYRALLRDVDKRFQCRLCREGAHAMSWKHPRDVVRHLRRDHFGLGDACPKCHHVVYTTGEMTSHRCKDQ